MEKSVKICLILTNGETASNISTILLNYGVTSFTTTPTEDGLYLINPDETKFIIIDNDFANNAASKFLEKLRSRDKNYSYLTICTSFTATNELLATLKQYNLVSFIKKPITMDLIKQKIEQILKKFADHFPARKSVRIKPEPDEMMRANFRHNNKFYSSKVIDISLGGVACEIYSQNDNPEIDNQIDIENICINIEPKEIQVNAKVVSIKSRFISLKFTDFKGKSYEILTKYILSKIAT